MAITYSQIISGVRSDLGDTYPDAYAYSDEDMIRYAAQGVREMWNLKPSLKYNPATGRLYDDTTVIPAAFYQSDFTVPIATNLIPALEYYIQFRCLSRDVTDAGNAAAAKGMKDHFDAMMG
jgi:hypothetical protein